MGWIVEPEYIAAIAISIIFFYTFQEHASSLLKLRVFRVACTVSVFAILINIGSIHSIENAANISLAFNYFINSLFFIATTMMLTAISAYALVLLFEDHYQTKLMRYAFSTLAVVLAASIVLTLLNLRTGDIFSFDKARSYIRGPINPLMYIAMVADLAVIMICHFLERKRVSRSFTHVARTVIPMAVVIGFLQLLRPNTMLTGTIAALTLLILFINGQQQHVSTDHLTALFDREAFFELLSQNVAKRQPFHVVIVSLRDYKSVNVRHGQRAGDRFIQRIGQYLRTLYPESQACRFSGVEFALIIPDMPQTQYERIIADMCARFRLPWRLPDGTESTIGACYADIRFPDIVSEADELMLALEYAVRLAKSDPEHEIVHFDQQRRQELGRRNYIIDLINSALLKDRFFLHYQPILSVSRDCFTGAEVLLRLREENGVPVSPNEFIPLAEEAGLISELSWLVLDRACRFLSENRDSGIEWVSVNVSALEFRTREIVSRVFRTLDRYRLPHARLKIEITERVMLEDLPFTAAIITELKDGGVGVWLDDFGTGYSNLANVAMLPFECLKMDRMFLSDITDDVRMQNLYHSIVKSAKTLGIEVLAEGVETAEQVQILAPFGIDRIQGYYYAKPLEGDAFIACMPGKQPSMEDPH